ncbi:hypothetical protein Sp245p_04290 [Azospirillum baldaniorum]|uniref:Uncharacterized protein n=1 Tax=Azospirillum baldaniorum TaxID=1064539 RepID=A0A9P1JSW1_9PROT|nr:hypothetical protein Sp245p_04290 [Azospirillum baldaniorum]CCC99175.1 protein of unknown function [Azospirillum baldaniorum]
MTSPLPSREREGAQAKRGKGEGDAKKQRLDPRATLTRPLRGHPLPGRERGLNAKYDSRGRGHAEPVRLLVAG